MATRRLGAGAVHEHEPSVHIHPRFVVEIRDWHLRGRPQLKRSVCQLAKGIEGATAPVMAAAATEVPLDEDATVFGGPAPTHDNEMLHLEPDELNAA